MTTAIDQVEGDYVQTQPPASNDWHYVNVSRKDGKLFTWKNKAGVEWDLILIGEESGEVVKFEVGQCNKDKDMTLIRWGITASTRRMATLRLSSLSKKIQ